MLFCLRIGQTIGFLNIESLDRVAHVTRVAQQRFGRVEDLALDALDRTIEVHLAYYLIAVLPCAVLAFAADAVGGHTDIELGREPVLGPPMA